jgi:BioD-like phosphotransacetylase family protein
MEQKMQEERQRRARKEREEANLAADALRAILKEERIRMSRIAGELAQLKSMAAASQLESEVIEEGRINNLMRRLDDVQQEKGRIICELEREEEMVRILLFALSSGYHEYCLTSALSIPNPNSLLIRYKRS